MEMLGDALEMRCRLPQLFFASSKQDVDLGYYLYGEPLGEPRAIHGHQRSGRRRELPHRCAKHVGT